jgi:hypothetical protein
MDFVLAEITQLKPSRASSWWTGVRLGHHSVTQAIEIEALSWDNRPAGIPGLFRPRCGRQAADIDGERRRFCAY